MAKNEASPARQRSADRRVLTRKRTASYDTRVLAALPQKSAVRHCIVSRHAINVEVMHLAALRATETP